jgi:hypothetical protein
MNVGFAVRLSLGILLAAMAAGQDIKLNVTFVCNNERLYVESCNIRDLSDAATCTVAHPDRPKHNGFMAYTYETRGSLKQMLPGCQQPSAKEVSDAEARAKKRQDLYDEKVRAANPPAVPNAPAPPSSPAALLSAMAEAQKPKTPEQRATARCITSGRLPASCTGNALLAGFGKMISSLLPQGNEGPAGPAAGPVMAGVYVGADNWRLDFTADGVLVSCSYLSPDEHHYRFEFRNNLALFTIDTTPKPLVLSVKADGTMTAPGPVVLDGVVATGGGDTGRTFRDEHGQLLTTTQAMSHTGPVYDATGNPVNPASIGRGSFSPRRVTCPALSLSSKGAGVGIQTMQTDLLKTMFGGDKGPPTPPGIRMQGIFAASSGFSAQFYPESVILGCGPDSARAYPYTVVADGTRAFIKIDAPDHPLTVGFRPDGSLDPGTGPYQVHGRVILGQNDKGDFTFSPYEKTCNLAVLAPGKEIPSAGGTAAPAATTTMNLSTAAAPSGNATLSIVSALPSAPGAPNPMAGHSYVLLRESYVNVLTGAGIAVPPGMSPYVYTGTACANRTPDCPHILEAVKAASASAVRSNATGAGTLPGVPPGRYYLMISTRYNNQLIVWEQAVELKAGANQMTLSLSNATPIN